MAAVAAATVTDASVAGVRDGMEGMSIGDGGADQPVTVARCIELAQGKLIGCFGTTDPRFKRLPFDGNPEPGVPGPGTHSPPLSAF